MGRLKTGATWAAGIAVGIGIGAFAAGLQGQTAAPDRDERLAREFALAEMSRGRIGVTVKETTADEMKKEPGVGVGTVVVEGVQEESPAQKAGVQEGDVVLEFDGERVRSVRQFRRLVDETATGRSVPIVVSRAGQRTNLTVTPESSREFNVLYPDERMRLEMPGAPIVRALPRMRDFESFAPEIHVFASGRARLGVQVEALTEQLAEYFGVKQGVLVASVEKDSPADRAGLKAGDVITALDGSAVEDSRDLRNRLRRIEDDREFTLEVSRDRKAMTLKGKLDPESPPARRGMTF
jgi:serine protease Do